MKNISKGPVWIIFLILILVLAGFLVFLAKKPISNQLVTTNEERRGLLRLFPTQIEDYTFVTSDVRENIYNGVVVSNDYMSENTEGQGNPEVTYTLIAAKYEKKNSNEVIFVDLYFISKGKSWWIEQDEKNSIPLTIGDYKNIRLSKSHSISWYPTYVSSSNGTVSMARTREAYYEQSSGLETPRYSEQTGKNPITQYFLHEYPTL